MKPFIETRGAKKLMRQLRASSTAVLHGTQAATRKVALDIEGAAKRRAPGNTGRLRTGIRTRFQREDTTADIGVFEGARARGHQVNYAPFVEKGRGPGRMPPIEPLRLWALRVIGDPDAAYPIAKKIAERGTKAQPFLRPSHQRHAPRYPGRIALEVKRRMP